MGVGGTKSSKKVSRRGGKERIKKEEVVFLFFDLNLKETGMHCLALLLEHLILVKPGILLS